MIASDAVSAISANTECEEETDMTAFVAYEADATDIELV
jgi:hypothetical protein